MKGRTRKILSRFPAHFEADRPGKQLSAVGDALVTDLDEQTTAAARIRRAHRLGEAEELRDLLLIGALHGITPAELDLLFTRLERARALASALSSAATPAERDEAAEALCNLWGLSVPRPRLPLFATPHAPGDAPDLDAARAGLVEHARAAISREVLLDGVRSRIGRIAARHAAGNGTVLALLEGAANSLDLDILELFHSEDRFWHAATARDRLALTRTLVEPASAAAPARESVVRLQPATELMGIEENPLERTSTDQVARHHAELFSVLRRGFEPAVLRVSVVGKETLTVGPMLVNRDEGHGVGYAGAIAASSVVVFTEEGRVFLDGSDVTSFAFAWRGACFAGADRRQTDFVFDGPGVPPERRARFAEATPAGALNSGFAFPHSGESLPMPGIGIGETRFAFFVQQAHFSKLIEAGDEPEHVLRVVPRTAVGFLDTSVFAAAEGGVAPGSALVSLSWLEHRAFCVRVLIPRRFRALTPEDAEGLQTRQRVAQALQRFQPAGVEVRVEFIDDRWVLGSGTLAVGESADPIAQLRSGTLLWNAPA